MQRKQKDDIGKIQTIPIWNYILDYDGYANSDKRYKTKYHDDIPELEETFADAVKLAFASSNTYSYFNDRRSKYERPINEREESEGLTGMKYGFVEIKNINKENFHNLLSEFHLRPYKVNKITEVDFEKKIFEIESSLRSFISVIK